MYYQIKRMIPEQYTLNKFKTISMAEELEDLSQKENFKF